MREGGPPSRKAAKRENPEDYVLLTGPLRGLAALLLDFQQLLGQYPSPNRVPEVDRRSPRGIRVRVRRRGGRRSSSRTRLPPASPVLRRDERPRALLVLVRPLRRRRRCRRGRRHQRGG